MIRRLFTQLRGPIRRAAPYFFAVVIAFGVYHAAAVMLVNRCGADAPRNSETGILIGAEPLELGPEDAQTAVLLVHGFIGGSNNFGELPQRLAAGGCRVRAMLLPGHGTRPRDFAKTPASRFIPGVLEEIRALKETHEQVYVVGHSMGGSLSALAATIEDIDGLVLAAPYFGVTYRWYYVLPAETWTQLTAPFVRWVYKGDGFIRVKRREVADQIFSYRWVPSSGSKALVKFGKLARDPETLALVDCPVLMFIARDDHAASPNRAEKAFDGIGSDEKELVWLENSDHHIFWDYDREEVIDNIVKFIESIREDEAPSEPGLGR